jgi:hypothetical protein
MHLLATVTEPQGQNGRHGPSEAARRRRRGWGQRLTPKTFFDVCLALEAFGSFATAARSASNGANNPDDILYAAIVARVKSEITALPQPLRKTGLQVLDQFCRADGNREIGFMPHFFAETLTDNSEVNNTLLTELGAANFFCWMATVLYDDFIDEEGTPALLPFSNVAYRRSLEIYRAVLVDRPEHYRFVEAQYDLVDRANAWEVAHTRATVKESSISFAALPRYGNRMVLADRAFGHAVGPMLLAMRVPTAAEEQIAHVRAALQHYLIARQLNDDMHDWRDDLQAGQLSSVVSDLLRYAAVKPGTYSLDVLVPRLETYFLKQGLTRIGVQAIKHLRQANRALERSGLTADTGGFVHLLDDLQAYTQAALELQANEMAFVEAYKEQI